MMWDYTGANADARPRSVALAAAKRYGARAVGVDLDPARIRRARLDAAGEGVASRVTFVEQDLFETDVSPATVVTPYLLPEQTVEVPLDRTHRVFLWRLPPG